MPSDDSRGRSFVGAIIAGVVMGYYVFVSWVLQQRVTLVHGWLHWWIGNASYLVAGGLVGWFVLGGRRQARTLTGAYLMLLGAAVVAVFVILVAAGGRFLGHEPLVSEWAWWIVVWLFGFALAAFLAALVHTLFLGRR